VVDDEGEAHFSISRKINSSASGMEIMSKRDAPFKRSEEQQMSLVKLVFTFDRVMLIQEVFGDR
jgi:hypothetical protein